jgi:hypothetical protein
MNESVMLNVLCPSVLLDINEWGLGFNFRPLSPYCCGFKSCQAATQLANKTMVGLLKCLLASEIMQGGVANVFFNH